MKTPEEILSIEVKEEGYDNIQNWIINSSSYNIEQVIEDAMKQAQIEILEELHDRFIVGSNWEEYFEKLNELKSELK